MKSTWKPEAAVDAAQWNNATNWQPSGVPTEIAVFGESNQTAIHFAKDSQAQISSIELNAEALGYSFLLATAEHPALTITGAGVVNDSGLQQSFIIAAQSAGFNDPQLVFQNSATAGGADVYYCVGPENQQGYGGGVVHFENQANAGAALFKVWTGAGIPPKTGSTVGGEVAFSDHSSASQARFTIYGTLGTDGDTFGNVVFHDQATADQAVFETIGGTVAKGDGGNSQFYGQSTAANGVFYNYGGTCASANGGDVAFDAEANGGNAMFHNYAAPAEGAYGGVTSFNNNPPAMAVNQGTSAAHGSYLNYGARAGQLGGGGHLSLSAKYGSPTAANATIHNYGSTLAAKSSAGHTIFSISLPTPYWPTAGQATIYNHPAVSAGAAAGYTAFSVYNETSTPADASTQFPTADKATILNLGGRGDKVTGGYTVFSGQTSAGQATLIAYGGINGGYGGKISFYDQSVGGTAKIILTGNGELDLADHSGELTLSSLELTGGIISVQLGSQTTSLNLSESLSLTSSTSFYFWTNSQGGFAANTHYTLLTAPNLSQVTVDQFEGNDVNGLSPTFSIVGNELQVCFN